MPMQKADFATDKLSLMIAKDQKVRTVTFLNCSKG
jgi:hypothetical protein